MKRTTAIPWILAAAIIVVCLSSPPAVAACIPAKFGGNVQIFSPFFYTYPTFGDATGDNTHFLGRYWQTGNRSAANEGSCPVTDWLYGYVGVTYYWRFDINLGLACNVGCAVDDLTVYLEDQLTDNFILWSVSEGVGASGEYDFDYAEFVTTTFFAPGPAPRVRIDTSSRAGDTVNVDYRVDDPSTGVFGFSISTINIYSCTQAGQPSLDLPGCWTLIDTFAGTGGTGSAGVDCSNQALDVWLTSGLEVSGESAGFVTTPTQVECDPNLADPRRKIKVLDRTEGKRIKRK